MLEMYWLLFWDTTLAGIAVIVTPSVVLQTMKFFPEKYNYSTITSVFFLSQFVSCIINYYTGTTLCMIVEYIGKVSADKEHKMQTNYAKCKLYFSKLYFLILLFSIDDTIAKVFSVSLGLYRNQILAPALIFAVIRTFSMVIH